ncbi:leucyl/phenylalanyl-tRNA--protein transferase [Marinobacter sp. X15-166B]|uniref:leucyl/phenylalanyl-tRNA--protein transferase n=1 Tax=Marinobacter sp. X15-166B TaxID=1897620 RepID=UPI00085C2E32|nr:leucyl/phenylalanyl-tRNA--protein transferase [Marinobacter sp. X15-166B]OEY67211.1 leucyl/phenylalanyl-tRNA--protein transferase [Marinobacter sp. X15-166B]
MSALALLDDDALWFPTPERALVEPDGLLAVGGDLSPERLLLAYRHGIFPWYSDNQPILWWSPDPRCILRPERIHVSRSLRRTLNQRRFTVTLNRDFRAVIELCADSRDDGTWITEEMIAAYTRLHRQGHAHSIEAWDDRGALVGGLYGIALGRCFFGESMFSLQTDASKVIMVHLAHQLAAWGYVVMDCQVESGHLLRMGAECVPRTEFLSILEEHVDCAPGHCHWELQWQWPGAKT